MLHTEPGQGPSRRREKAALRPSSAGATPKAKSFITKSDSHPAAPSSYPPAGTRAHADRAGEPLSQTPRHRPGRAAQRWGGPHGAERP